MIFFDKFSSHIIIPGPFLICLILTSLFLNPGGIHSGYGGTFHCRIEDGNLKPFNNKWKISYGFGCFATVSTVCCEVCYINSKNLII